MVKVAGCGSVSIFAVLDPAHGNQKFISTDQQDSTPQVEESLGMDFYYHPNYIFY
jgi:hypothetical protein